MAARWTPRPSRSAATRSFAPPSISFRHESADRGAALQTRGHRDLLTRSARSLRAHFGTLAQPEVRTPDPRASRSPVIFANRKNGRVALQRMDNVGIVVESLDAAISFFAELGLELEGRAMI